MTERRQQPDRRSGIPVRGGGRRATDPPAEWVSTVDYARIHSVDPRTVRKWIAAGLVKSYKATDIVRVYNKPPGEQV